MFIVTRLMIWSTRFRLKVILLFPTRAWRRRGRTLNVLLETFPVCRVVIVGRSPRWFRKRPNLLDGVRRHTRVRRGVVPAQRISLRFIFRKTRVLILRRLMKSRVRLQISVITGRGCRPLMIPGRSNLVRPLIIFVKPLDLRVTVQRRRTGRCRPPRLFFIISVIL